MKEGMADQLRVKVYSNRKELGADAATMVANNINALLAKQESVNMIFAAAASQHEFLDSLIEKEIDWSRINAFHMDEYIGLPAGASQQFGYFLNEKIFHKVPFKQVFYLNGQATDLQEECARYASLLEQHTPDITCMGIGENTHLAFNDPHVANFNDPVLVKVVDLDEACKQQQVNEGCFADVREVPNDAFTLTVPALLKASTIYCMVPGSTKADAVYHTLVSDISEKYPSTILRTLPNAILFLDPASAAKVEQLLESAVVSRES
ncbi:glucosamine-6-phosphate deaminase [Paraflavitalea soli]|uniref:Glucosamine-6-phosphate deaminase n=1 Tax=Paraflavitalea soli TaxID=2315862 RepID=A0A3B7MMG8_9BACT|nr:glucosamine-6-phosphate deaminase [Paraflavitalea soli]AXY74240.1 glucosamine-6-phosphate deaminase [Paraflavitalea soli]